MAKPNAQNDPRRKSQKDPRTSDDPLWLPPMPETMPAVEGGCSLVISEPNAKIPHWSFSLPSGFTCPGAVSCLAKADRKTGKITDGPDADFRCYSASQEALYPNLRKQRWTNFDALRVLRTSDRMAKGLAYAIDQQLPRSQRIFRIHVGGDFFNQTYFNAWIMVAHKFPELLFYGYTKSVQFLVAAQGQIPRNLRLHVSKGGRWDDAIDQHGLKFSVVVRSPEEAANYRWHDSNGKEQVGLEIDHDDSHAWKDNKPFALLIHGIQPKGSKAAEDLKKLGGIAGSSSYGKDRPRISLPTFQEFRAYSFLEI
jgi:hypothetical protein